MCYVHGKNFIKTIRFIVICIRVLQHNTAYYSVYNAFNSVSCVFLMSKQKFEYLFFNWSIL